MKRFLLIMTAALMVLGMASCGSTDNNKQSGAETTIADSKGSDNKKSEDKKSDNSTTASPADIEKKIADALGNDAYLCNIDIEESTLTGLYGLDMSKIESYAAKQNTISSVNPDTVIILKTKDGYAEKAAEAINTAYAQVVDYIRQYPFATAKVMNGRLYCSGDYVLYIVAGASYDGEDSEAENKLALAEYAKIDDAVKEIFGSLPKNSAVVPEDDGNRGGFIDVDENDDGEILVGGR